MVAAMSSFYVYLILAFSVFLPIAVLRDHNTVFDFPADLQLGALGIGALHVDILYFDGEPMPIFDGYDVYG